MDFLPSFLLPLALHPQRGSLGETKISMDRLVDQSNDEQGGCIYICPYGRPPFFDGVIGAASLFGICRVSDAL